jgi:hypothetical protein
MGCRDETEEYVQVQSGYTISRSRSEQCCTAIGSTARHSMKEFERGQRCCYVDGMKWKFVAGLCLAVVFCGCQSTPKTVQGREGVTYTNTIHNLQVWAANDFQGADLRSKTLVVTPTRSDVPAQEKRSEAAQFDRLRRLLADQLFYELESKRIFQRVVSPNAGEPATAGNGAGDLRLETSIVEYYPGNAALRFTVGFSAGYPSITVYGVLRDASGEPVLRFETQREFEARPFEYGDEQILENNVKDLAKDLSDYLDRVIQGKPLKK